jgi:hypothetical protein
MVVFRHFHCRLGNEQEFGCGEGWKPKTEPSIPHQGFAGSEEVLPGNETDRGDHRHGS